MVEVRWVGQEDEYGCGIACVAMIAGLTYAEAKALFPRQDFSGEGRSHVDYDQCLMRLGYAVARLYRYWDREALWEWPPRLWSRVHLCEVIVPGSTNGSHLVVALGGGRVLDPLTPEPRRLTDYQTVYHVAAVAWLGDRPVFADQDGPGTHGGEGATG